MTLQNLLDILRKQGNTRRLLELRLSAYQLSRAIGGQTRIMTVSCVVTTPLILLLYKSDRLTWLSEDTLMTAIVVVLVAATLAICLNDVFLKTFAAQITLDEANALDRLAASGNAEAAFCLAELHAKRGADAHEFMWLERATKMGHRKAAELLRKRNS
ncbi:hypothetical protein ABVF61_30540 [Roseibium sp. HPY-6]|uniref:hypothetical protein n=1 Tax=Roseibium sp. HPY-6 TaxID=3229852 RepID=UPI0033902F07